MSKRKTSVPSDYTVGYGRPPKGTQFPPGKSGNPNGRRKGSRSVGAVLNDVFRQTIEVTENGKTRRVAGARGDGLPSPQRRPAGRRQSDKAIDRTPAPPLRDQ